MAKLHRTSRPPTGAFTPLRNTRLYGDRDTQIAGASLAARGTPNTDRAYVGSRKRSELRLEREQSAHVGNVQRAQTAMLQAQRAVRAAKEAGQDYRALAATARDARARYIALTGGTERRSVDVAQGAESNPVRAT
jgi:hypothetical protein